MNVPIPPVFLVEDEYGTYVVLDGRQRLTAVNEFLRNSYQLKGLKVWEELNDLTYNELQKRKLEQISYSAICTGDSGAERVVSAGQI